MKFKLCEKSDKNTITLYLEQEGSMVILYAEDSNDESWTLLELHEDGSVNTLSGLDQKLGFDVDEDGNLKITKE